MPQIATEVILADKAYDADERVVTSLRQQGIEVVILPKKNCKDLPACDDLLYQAHHPIENLFVKLNELQFAIRRSL